MENNIIIYTLIQELQRAIRDHPDRNIRVFAEELLAKVDYELEAWKPN